MEKGKLSGLLPIFVFLLLFIGLGIFAGDFYAIPALVVFIIALIVAFCQNRKVPFEDKLTAMAKNAGDKNIIIMCMVFILAGAFSGAVSAAGGATSTVNFGLSILPSSLIVAGLFLIACFISISMGTSVGTIVALTPIAVGVADTAGFSLAVCVAAVASGAMFGDNLSMISDTTIAAVRTQGCEMKDKFRENFKIVLPAAIITFIIFLILGGTADYQPTEELVYSLWEVLPYLVVLVTALLGVNVFVVLILGTVLSLIVGIANGSFTFMEMFGVMNDGITGMFEITVISLTVAGIVGLVKQNGGIDYILYKLKTVIKTKRGAEAGIATLAVLMDASAANNTVAIVMAGPIAKEIAEEYDITPKRTASLLDIFASVGQGLIPYGAQLLYAAAGATTLGFALTPFEIIPYMFYPILMAISALLFIAFKGKRKTKKEAKAEAK